MTGFSALPLAEEGREDNAQWAGVSRIMGPRWAHLPTLTVGLLGCQVLWSVEMSYGVFKILRNIKSISIDPRNLSGKHRHICFL